jgi:signal peptidase
MDQEEKDRRKAKIIEYLIAAGIVAAIIGVPLLSAYAYSGGIWPPMMVVSSGSMTHEDRGFGHIGSIETGDIIIPKKVDFDDIVTWAEGKERGYRTYGDYGDVIIYYRNGNRSQPPVIHRAMLRIGNETVGINTVTNAKGYEANITIGGNGKFNVNITVRGPSGKVVGPKPIFAQNNTLITWGDNNDPPDQILKINNYEDVEPVQEDWVLGVSRGELPWMGLLSLGIRSIFDSSDIHLEHALWDCWFMFGVVIGCIVAAIILIEFLPPLLRKLKKS